MKEELKSDIAAFEEAARKFVGWLREDQTGLMSWHMGLKDLYDDLNKAKATLDQYFGVSDMEKAAEYYKAGLRRALPPFIPKRVTILLTARGDGPWSSTMVVPGEYECSSNRYGAISVKATNNGRNLGIKPTEFEVVEWMPNPHLEAQSSPEVPA